MATQMAGRNKTIFHVQYIIVLKDKIANPLLPPSELDNEFLSLIKHLPKNLLQLSGETIEYISHEWFTYSFTGFDINIFYEQDFEDYVSMTSTQLITVLFIDKEITNRDKMLALMNSLGFFYYIFSNPITGYNKTFLYPHELIELLKSDEVLINLHFKKYHINANLSFYQEIPEEFKDIGRPQFFIPAIGNSLMINQYIGHLWHNEVTKTAIQNTNDIEQKEELEKYYRTAERMNIFIEQIRQIDKIRRAVVENLKIENDLGSSIPFYSPLIIVSPFQYPILEEVVPDIEQSEYYLLIKEAYRLEQDKNYMLQIDTKDREPEELMRITKEFGMTVQYKMSYLDNIAYLHSSFTFSPILRLPLKGKSLNSQLAIFNPAKPLPRKQKFFNAVKKFGELYVSTSMTPELQKMIEERNGQLIFISDLPVEWFNIGNVPLCFTHDITRMAETPYAGLMSFYVSNQKLEFKISEDVIKKTLVIFGAPTENGENEHFEVGYKIIEEKSKELGYKIARCKNIGDLRKALADNSPEILIFDTHGQSVKNKKTTLLQIGSDWLSREDIVNHNIYAPIVILSACATVPNWGYLGPITNAFFETGSISVTGTFLPIGIVSGTIFYHRIINNLHYAATEGMHSNWLNFISHNIRSNYISEIFLEVYNKIMVLKNSNSEKELILNKAQNLATELLMESMLFSKRRQLFLDIENRISNLHPDIRINVSKLPLEQLLYTNLGRGDLIYFDSWLKTNKTSVFY